MIGGAPVLLAAAIVLLAVAYLGLALRMPLGTVEQPGPALFPLVVGLGLAAAGLGYAVEAVRGTAPAAPVARAARARVLAVAGALAASCLALPVLGFVVAVTPPLAVVLALFGLRRPGAAAALALALAAAGWAVFAVALGVPLPRGRWAP